MEGREGSGPTSKAEGRGKGGKLLAGDEGHRCPCI